MDNLEWHQKLKMFELHISANVIELNVQNIDHRVHGALPCPRSVFNSI
jgi:hypothetical protein